jgi:Leucine-rich repeat (LRR) protein
MCDSGTWHWEVPPGISALRGLLELRLCETDVLAAHACHLSTLTTLRRLSMEDSYTENLHWLQGLTGLTFLRHNCFAGHDLFTFEQWEEALAPMTQLKLVDLHLSELRGVPPCVCQLAGLTGLRLGSNPLNHLPPGPYLLNLRLLDVAGSNVMELPLDDAPGALQQLELLGLGYSWSDLPPQLTSQLRARAAQQPAGTAFPHLQRLHLDQFSKRCKKALRGLMRVGVLPTVPIETDGYFIWAACG